MKYTQLISINDEEVFLTDEIIMKMAAMIAKARNNSFYGEYDDLVQIAAIVIHDIATKNKYSSKDFIKICYKACSRAFQNEYTKYVIGYGHNGYSYKRRRAVLKLMNELNTSDHNIIASKLGITPDQVKDSLNLTYTSSLDKVLYGEDENAIHLYDVIPDNINESSESKSFVKHLRAEFDNFLKEALTPLEYSVVKASFNLNDTSYLSDTELGLKFGVSRQYICQIKKNALDKIKNALEMVSVLQLIVDKVNYKESRNY